MYDGHVHDFAYGLHVVGKKICFLGAGFLAIGVSDTKAIRADRDAEKYALRNDNAFAE